VAAWRADASDRAHGPHSAAVATAPAKIAQTGTRTVAQRCRMTERDMEPEPRHFRSAAANMLHSTPPRSATSSVDPARCRGKSTCCAQSSVCRRRTGPQGRYPRGSRDPITWQHIAVPALLSRACARARVALARSGAKASWTRRRREGDRQLSRHADVIAATKARRSAGRNPLSRAQRAGLSVPRADRAGRSRAGHRHHSR
jgi:hypothetical protein